jgi:hypothetical protein
MIEATIKGVKVTPEIVRRFWDKVDVRSPDECWDWMGGRANTGYGNMKIQEKRIGAHRIAYTLVNGTISHDGSYHGGIIMHSCDRPSCCNPFHLRLGDAQANMDDKVLKGRSARGEKNTKAKLTNAQVLEIRKMYSKGRVTQRSLAQKYGVIQQAIQAIVTRTTWKHI